MKELKGKTIKEIYVSKDMQSIVFKCIDGYIQYDIDNDCCSDGWIEHVSNVLYCLPALVLEVEEINIGDVMPTIQEVDTLYGIKMEIETEYSRDYINIEFRNSSNGYYGSSMHLGEFTTLDEFDIIEYYF